MIHFPNNRKRLTPEMVDNSFTTLQHTFRQEGEAVVGLAGKIKEHVDKADGSPVTAEDHRIEERIKAALKATGIPAYGEETGYGGIMPETFWLIDPIDGTRDFIENVPHFTIMGALIDKGETVAAAIYNPSTKEMYTAQKDKGAVKDGVRLDLRAQPLPRTALCKEHLIEAVNAMLAPAGVVGQKAPRGCGFGFTMVLDGLAAARFNLQGGGHTHDYAPGALLVREAGGAIIPIAEDKYTYETRSFVACHPGLEAVIRPHIAVLRNLESARNKQ